jgi:predicted ATPase
MPTSVPPLLTATIGREQPLVALTSLLQRLDARIITITGPGGVGKTRLALEVASRIEREHGVAGDVVFVSLADIRDPALVVPTITGRLGMVEPAGGSPVSALADHLRDREILLVLDNLEQVVDRGCGC